ncbi:MAG TPA: hypothetical protein DHT34_03605, partial [Cellvibrionales bacterium]|nr:hypothetical protein [Cellvibrionales bacterium]
MNNKKPKIALFKKISQVAVLFTALASAQFSSAAMVSLNLNDILGFSQIDFSGSVSAQSAQT